MIKEKKKTIPIVPDEIVMSKIFFIRDQKIMLDSDLATLYGVETRVLNQAVQRRPDRFPDDFMFRLNVEEWEILKSQYNISSWGGRRQLPYVFTEHGVLMLSSVLNSAKAIEVNIQIMRIFTRIRNFFADNSTFRIEIEQIKSKLKNQTKNIELVFKYLDELMKKHETRKPRKIIGYKLTKKTNS